MDRFVKCQNCNGTRKCPRCKGAGEYPDSFFDDHCFSCMGSSTGICAVCEGSKIDSRIMNTEIGTIGISEFVRRQDEESRFSYCSLSDKNLLWLISDNLDTKRSKYRPDVLGIIVPPQGFYSGIVEMKDGDELAGVFAPRKEGEEPRTQIGVVGRKKMPAKFVEIILYSRKALAEGNENSLNVDHEIISINASPIKSKDIPLRPMTLVSNYFQLSGGTATGMDEKEFIAELKNSMEFWKNKGMAADGS